MLLISGETTLTLKFKACWEGGGGWGKRLRLLPKLVALMVHSHMKGTEVLVNLLKKGGGGST